AELELPHTGASATFSFRTNRPPEHTIKITVTEEETAEPVENVEVRLGVYRASTDEQGSAIVELPKGTYDLSFRRDGYKAEPMTVEVSADVTVQVKASTVPKREEGVSPFPKWYWG
ncbi:MAG: carboxypeptidase-like regulatory domain-containing protein, partial [bacterium]